MLVVADTTGVRPPRPRAGEQGPRISVVVPVYGCVECLDELCSRLTTALDSLTARYEIVLVDDRSPDESWNAITRLRAAYPAVRGIRLSRNFGQHIAITAGLAAARGDVAVVMDCDLQDPPEKIPELYAKLCEGYEMVLARRVERHHSTLRVWAARIYFGVLSRLTEERIDGSYGSFSILSRKVIDAFLQFRERERHYLFILRFLGFRTGTIDFAHEARANGRSAYTAGRLIRHALAGVFFETVLLRWLVVTGLAVALGGALLAVFLVYRYFAYGSVAGWTSVVVLLLMCTGSLLVGMGIIGMYIGKIFDQTKERPLFVLDTVDEASTPW